MFSCAILVTERSAKGMYLKDPDGLSQNEKEILCVHRVLAGDTEAFRLIVSAYETRLRSFCRSRLPESEVDDAMQDVFLKVFCGLGTFRPGYPFGTWFFTVAYNSIAGKKLRFKKELDKKSRLLRFAPEETGSNEGQKNLEAEMIRDAVAGLSGKNRQVVELYYFAELDVAQIAKILSIGESSVKTRLFRSRKELRKHLDAGNGTG